MNKKKISRVIASALAANMIASPIADNIKIVSAAEISDVSTNDSGNADASSLEESSGVATEQMQNDFESIANEEVTESTENSLEASKIVYGEGVTCTEIESETDSTDGEQVLPSEEESTKESKNVFARLVDILSDEDEQAPEFVYLSDLEYDKLSNIKWQFNKDKNSDLGKITLIVNGQARQFDKGIGTHAPATIIYDVSEYSDEYTKLIGYLGVDYSKRNLAGDGVDFRVEISDNGSTWTVVDNVGMIKASEEAHQLNLDIQGVKYIKISAQTGPNSSNDHSVLGGIRLAKSDYDITAETDSSVNFSFDGDNANKIVVNTSRQDTIKYSLDGGSSWTTPSNVEDREGNKVISLGEEEVKSIGTTNGIKVKIGVYEYSIAINKLAKPTTSNVYKNDWENKFFGAIENLEYSTDNGATWHKYTPDKDFGTNKIVTDVRFGATGQSLASDSARFTFQADGDTVKEKYLTVDHLSVFEYCSQETAGADNKAENFIDGNGNTVWHNNWNNTDQELFYAVKLDTIRFIKRIDYIPTTGNNGKLKSGKILASIDGKVWDEVGSFKDLANNNNTKSLKLDYAVATQYIKIVATETYGSPANKFFSGSMLNFYEDTTLEVSEDVSVSYSRTENGTNSVTANLVLPPGFKSDEKSYTFSKNGTHTFHYTDADGKPGTIEATVNNITRVNTDNGVYLSDLDTSAGTIIGYKELKKDKNIDGGTISLMVNGSPMNFNRGIGMHATSTVIYDISGYSDEFTRFTGYIGVDTSMGENGSVKFTISASRDGKEWIELEKPEKLFTGNTESVFVDVNVKDYKYLKIYADMANGNNSKDHSVVGNARLVKESYDTNVGCYTGFRTLAEYDAEISSRSVEENYANHKQQILEREFVSRYGYNNIISASRDIAGVYDALAWLQTDSDALQLLIEAGNLFSGNGYNALKTLGGLFKECRADLETPIYKKMILATAAGYSKNIKPFMVNYGGGCLEANPVESYKALKAIYDTEGGFVRKEEFNTYSMELIRAVMDARITYDEIKWLRNYVDIKYPGTMRWERFNGYGYARYVNTGYGDAALYDEKNKETYDKKYHLSENGVSYGDKNIYRAWMFMEKGAICWGLSGLGMVVNEVQGIPAIGTFQPGHEAYMLYSQTADGKGTWSISDNIAGWKGSFTRWGGTIQTEHRLLLGWGQKEYNTLNSGNNSSYMLLAQDALNDYSNYLNSMFYNLIANSYEAGSETHESALNESLKHYSKNLDSMYGLYKSYLADKSKTDEDWEKLASKVAEEYKYFPAPMVDLLKLIRGQIKDESFKISVDIMQNNSLKAASVATPQQSLQNSACQQVAQSLLGNSSTELATFSFDGENAGKVMINDVYSGSTIQVRISLDGGETWEQFNEKDEFTTDHVIQLTEEQIARIDPEKDILVGLMGRPENHTIDIKTGKILDLNKVYQNELENSLIGDDIESLEYSLDGNEWKDYVGGLDPNVRFEGATEVYFRYKATGVYLQGDAKKVTFAKDTDSETSKYVQLKDVSIHSFSSEQTATDKAAKNLIDGRYSTRWHTSWDINDTEKYISFEFDEVKFINKIGYMPYDDSGEMKSGNVYVSMDGENWTKVYEYKGVENVAAPKWKYLDLGNSYPAKYIKIDSTESYWSKAGQQDLYFAGRMIAFYEDTTKVYKEEASVVYSTTEKTSGSVIATLVLPAGCKADVTSHKFIENGNYTFTYTDKDGNSLSVTATVANIERDVDSSTIYLSDIDYVESLSSSAWNGIVKDAPPEGSKIQLKIDGQTTSFDKGIGAHAYSQLVYDIEGYSKYYDRFTAYVGVDASRGNNGSVKFKVLASKDGYVWDTLQEVTDALSGNSNAVKVDVEISDYSYLKLIADDCGHNAFDHAVYADAKFIRDEAKVTYSTSSGKVTAKVYLAEGCKVIGDSQYVFETNGEHTFTYTTATGEEKTIDAVVNWLDSTTSEDDPNIDEGFGIESEDEKDTCEKDENIDENFGIESNGDDKDVADQFPDIDEDFGMRDPSTSEDDPNIDENFGIESEDEIDTSEKDENLDDNFLVEDTRYFEVEFDRTELTNQNVTAKLVGLHEGDKVKGGESHLFEQNGKYTFYITDVNGNEFAKEVEVTWIDKEAPTAVVALDYSKVDENKVIAKLVDMSKENVTILGDGEDTHEFTSNGSYTFRFVDKAGNEGTAVANVDWFKFDEADTIVDYRDFVDNKEVGSEDSENDSTEGNESVEEVKPDFVLASISIDKDKMEIVNNNGSEEVKFVKNGEFRFRVRMIETNEEFDILVKVDWLAEDAKEGESPIEATDKDIANQDPDVDNDFGMRDPSTSEDDPNIDENFGIESEDDKDVAGNDPVMDENFGIESEGDKDITNGEFDGDHGFEMGDPSTSEDDPNIDENFGIESEGDKDVANGEFDGDHGFEMGDPSTSEKDEDIDNNFGIESEDDKDVSDKDEDIDPDFGIESEGDKDITNGEFDGDHGFEMGDPSTSEKDENIDENFGVESEGDKDITNGEFDGDHGFEMGDPSTSEKDENIDENFGVESDSDKDIADQYPDVDEDFGVVPPVVEDTPVAPPVTNPDKGNGNNGGNVNSGGTTNNGSSNGSGGSSGGNGDGGSSGGNGTTGGNGDGDDPNKDDNGSTDNTTSDKDPNVDPDFGIESDSDKDIADQNPDIDENFGMRDPSTSDKDENIDPDFGIESDSDKDIANQDPDVDNDFGMGDPSTSDKDEDIDNSFGIESEGDKDVSDKDNNIDENFGIESDSDKDIANQDPDVDNDFGMRDPSTSDKDENIDDGFLVGGDTSVDEDVNVDEPTVDEDTSVDEDEDTSVDEDEDDSIDEPTIDEPTVDEDTSVDEDDSIDEPTIDEPTVDEDANEDTSVDEGDTVVDEDSNEDTSVDGGDTVVDEDNSVNEDANKDTVVDEDSNEGTSVDEDIAVDEDFLVDPDTVVGDTVVNEDNKPVIDDTVVSENDKPVVDSSVNNSTSSDVTNSVESSGGEFNSSDLHGDLTGSSESTDASNDESDNESTNESVGESTSESTNESVSESVGESTNESSSDNLVDNSVSDNLVNDSVEEHHKTIIETIVDTATSVATTVATVTATFLETVASWFVGMFKRRY